MKLIDLINDIETLDEELIIFIEDKEDSESDIILAFGEDGDQGIIELDGKKYYYLLEGFLAKEQIEDWKEAVDYSPSSKELAKVIYDYGINDA